MGFLDCYLKITRCFSYVGALNVYRELLHHRERLHMPQTAPDIQQCCLRRKKGSDKQICF